MKKWKFQKQLAWFMSILLIFSLVQPLQSASAEEDITIYADAAVLVDAGTGQVLYAKNADKVLGIASMTKMMTEYLLLEAIKEKKLSLDTEYEVSEYVYKISQNRSLSNVPLRLGEKYTIGELYEAMTIYSANAATIAIAETIAGSETKFVELMNEKAKELGLKDFKFVNSSGLNNRDLMGMHPKGSGPEDENVMSARATAKLAYELLNTFPEVLETSSIPKKTFREGTDDKINMENWNWMLPSLVFGYEGMDGLKTGTTDFAGYCFTGTAERDGRRLISVVMNAKDENGKGSYNSRFVETKKMLDYGFERFEYQEVFPAAYQPKGNETIEIVKGKEKEVKVQSKEPLKLAVKKAEKINYSPVFTAKKSALDENGNLLAPIQKGQTVGYLSVTAPKGQIEYLTNEEVQRIPVVAAESVEKANWFTLSLRAIGGFFVDIWGSIASTVSGWFS
ncbi:MAG TPA: D-alanyl-D-alanine carboxypeptidase family protein [Chondromyces sp.]|nr:D-alanyl-D-alanine carboxypeptidase family protein [Chondromyces sp.]